jgi:hypothetical protein
MEKFPTAGGVESNDKNNPDTQSKKTWLQKAAVVTAIAGGLVATEAAQAQTYLDHVDDKRKLENSASFKESYKKFVDDIFSQNFESEDEFIKAAKNHPHIVMEMNTDAYWNPEDGNIEEFYTDSTVAANIDELVKTFEYQKIFKIPAIQKILLKHVIPDLTWKDKIKNEEDLEKVLKKEFKKDAQWGGEFAASVIGRLRVYFQFVLKHRTSVLGDLYTRYKLYKEKTAHYSSGLTN